MDLKKKEQLKRLLREVKDRSLSRRRKMAAVNRILAQYHPAQHVPELTGLLYDPGMNKAARGLILMMLFAIAIGHPAEAAAAGLALKRFAADPRQPQDLRDNAFESLMLMGWAKPAVKA
jgi:hypothetical protein